MSPTKNDDVLQAYVKMSFGKEIILNLDCKTRWNSLLPMLKTFNKLRTCIQKSLIDLNSPIIFSEAEFNLLFETISVLEPIKLAVEAICRQDANLLMADASFSFLFKTLIDIKGEFCKELYNKLRERIEQRRTNLSGVIQYLHKGNEPDSSIGFARPKKITIIRIISTFVERLIEKSQVLQSTSPYYISDLESTNSSDEENNKETVSLQEKLQRAINESNEVPKKKDDSSDINTKIRKEISIFDDTGFRGKYLELCYKYMLCIPPTSVEAERAFSTSGRLCSKIRSRLSDESINNLCFLNAYFIANPNK